jgi:hypothetical protein
MIFAETYLGKHFQIPGFYAKHLFGVKSKSNATRRGVSIYFNNKTGNLISHQTTEHLLILKFEYFTVIGAYFDPETSKIDMCEALLECFESLESIENVILAGDFNCRMDNGSQEGKDLLDITEWYKLKLANKSKSQLTYICEKGGSTIDLIFTGEQIKCNNFRIVPTTVRKHQQITVDCEVINLNEIDIVREKSIKIDEEKLIENFENLYKNLLEGALIDKNADLFYELLQSLIKDSGKRSKNFVKRGKEWFDRECKISRKEFLDYRKNVLRFYSRENRNLGLFIANLLRKDYLALIKRKKEEFYKLQEDKILKEAENACYKIQNLIKGTNNQNENQIPLPDWAKFYEGIFNKNDPANNDETFRDIINSANKESNFVPLLDEEIFIAIRKLKNKKSPGPDKITNENIKTLSTILLPHITAFFNICLEKRDFPEGWKYSKMKLLYKQKGSRDDMNSYRGIAVSNSLLNVLERALYARIFSQTAHIIPDNQYGFVPGRSTLQAVNKLILETESVINEVPDPNAKQKPRLYVFFLDIKKAFDTCSRRKVFENIVNNSNLSEQELSFIAELLKENYYVIDDGVNRSERILQTEGLKQGSVLSPLFFNVSNHDINEAVRHLKDKGLILLSYADDTALACRDLKTLKEAILSLIEYFKARNLNLNLEKCELMRFNKTGKGRYEKDGLKINGKEIKFSNSFNYLGVTFQPSGTTFTKHIERRRIIALLATYDIPKLSSLSIETGLKLFNLKIAPILSYGIEVIWKHLSKDDFLSLERGKASFVRKLLSVSKSTRTRFTYSLVNCNLFVEELKHRFHLPDTPAYLKFYRERELELETLPRDFFTVDAFHNDEWKKPQFKLRHVYTRFACHGFHHLICKNKKYHIKTDKCVCELCENPCDRYHLRDCPNRVKSLVEYASMKKKK